MILKALYDYYKRMEAHLPAFGMELKEIHYVVIIDKNGNFLRFESKRIDKKLTTQFCVAKGFKRTSAPKSNILWDNGKYVFGFNPEDKKCHDLFVDIVIDLAGKYKEDSSIQALKKFYTRDINEIKRLFESDILWDEISKSLSSNFSFQLEGDDVLIAEKKELIKDYLTPSDGNPSGKSKDGPKTGVCLITGKKSPIVRLTTATPILNCQSVASLVGIQVSSGYDSYGKSQAYNSPISEEAEFAYSTALKKLLGKESKNKYTIGQRIFLFWGSKENKVMSEAEALFCDFLNIDFIKQEQNPDEKISEVEKFFKAIWSGEIKTELDDKFFFLGLAPNIGRIAVVYFEEVSLKDFAEKLLRHFEDMEIVDSRPKDKQRPYRGLYSILSSVTLGGKASDASPNLPEAVMRSMLDGIPYPYQLLTSTIQRINAEYMVSTCRAAILKAYISRKEIQTSNKLSIMLDKNNDNSGYLCGRLTAVLEKIQSDVNSGDSIKTRFMTAASATPSAVFPSMLSLSMHHMEKLSEGSRIFYEQLKQEIIEKLSSDGFPSQFDLMDQGRFFVGYYHQRADLYTSKK